MNQKVKIGAIVVVALAAALALPVMHLTNKDAAPQQRASATPAPTEAPIAPTAPTAPTAPPEPVPEQEPLIWEGTYAPPSKPVPQYLQERGSKAGAEGKKDTGTDLTAETLVGTAWQVNTPQGAVTVEFGPNGQGSATHPLVGAIPATWRVQGNKVIATASFMGQSMTIDAVIQGQALTVHGQSIKKMR